MATGAAPAPSTLDLPAFAGPGGRDARLQPAVQLIESGAVSVLSLDVFDTLLWRTVPRPSDAFVLLAEELSARQLLQPGIDPAAFRRLRILAEARARRKKEETLGGTEVFLEEIWRQVPTSVVRSDDTLALVEIEVALERRITVPDLDILSLVALAGERGVRTVLVSNTYFSERHLRTLLSRPEMASVVGVPIFASCEHGVHKGTGLFDVVLGSLGVPAPRVVHVGDEYAADVEGPARHHIRSVQFHRYPGELEQVLRAEGALPSLDQPPSRAVVHRTGGDFGFTALRTKAAGRVELEALPASLREPWQFGVSVLGPVLAGFAEWVHRRARAAGADTVWCMMREGEFLADLVNAAGRYVPEPVAAEPIWLSRQVTSRAALFDASREELEALLVRRVPPTVQDLLANLGLGLGEVPELRPHAVTRLDDPAFTDTVLDVLTGSEHLRARARDTAAGARRRLLDYLRATVGPREQVVLVDLGWGGTIQRQLERVLEGVGSTTATVGLYLMTNEAGCRRLLDGVRMEGYLGHCGEPAEAVVQIGRSPEVVEQACLSTTGSLVDFAADGSPVLDESVPPPEQVMEKIAVQQGVKAFQREVARYRRSLPEVPTLDGSERDLLLEVLRRSVVRPTPSEVSRFGAWSHEDNFGSTRRDDIVAEDLAPLVPYLNPSDLARMTMSDSFWPMGLAARHDPALAAAAIAVADGSVPSAAFEASRSPAMMEMWADTGNGFAHRVARPLAVNRNGLSYAQFSFREGGIQAIRFDPCDTPAVVRLDWIDVVLGVLGRSEPVRFRIDTETELSGLTYVHCKWLYDGVLLCTNDDPQVHVPVRGRAGGEIYSADVRVAFAMVQLPQPQQPLRVSTPRVAGYGTAVRRVAGKVRAEHAEGGLAAVGRGAARLLSRQLPRR